LKRYPWYRHYMSSKSNHKRRGLLHDMTTTDFKELWFRDKAWELERPSIDRIDNNRGYHKDNCRFIELRLNQSLGGKIRTTTQKMRDVIRAKTMAMNLSNYGKGRGYCFNKGSNSWVVYIHYQYPLWGRYYWKAGFKTEEAAAKEIKRLKELHAKGELAPMYEPIKRKQPPNQ